MRIKESENFVEIEGSISSVKSLQTIAEIKNDLNLSLLEWKIQNRCGHTSMYEFKTKAEKHINSLGKCEIRLLFQKRKLKNYQTKL